MNKAPLNQEDKETEAVSVTEEVKDSGENAPETNEETSKGKKKRFGKDKKPAEKKSKIPENETEEERKEREKKEEEKKKKKPKDIKEATRRLIKYITKYKALLIVVAVLVVLTTVISVLTSLAMLPIYEVLEKAIIDKNADGKEIMSTIIKWLLIMAGGYTLSALLNLLYSRLMLHVSSHTLMNMRRDLFNHIQGLPLEFFDKRKTGEIMSRFTNDINRVSDLVSSNFPTLISSIIQAVMTITIMIVFSWKLTLTISVAIVLMFSVVIFITSKCSPLFKAQQKAIGEVNGYSEEYIKGIKVVKLFCYEDTTKAAFNTLNENYRKIGVKANIISGFMSPLMSMITRVNYAIVVVLGATFVLSGEMSVATLITYLDKSKSYASPIVSIAGTYSSLVSALAGAERVFEILDTPNETDEGKTTLVRLLRNALGEEEETDSREGKLAWKVPENDTFKYVPLKGNIEVKDVTFAYVEGTDVIKNIDVTAKSGNKVAFVGSTGAGKTTITNLINRFYEIDHGTITYDGIDIKDIKKVTTEKNSLIKS